MFPQIALGAYIALNGRILYPYYDLCGRLYPSISGRYDQLAGGIVVWIPAAMMSIVSFLLVLNNLRRHEENVATTRDDGEQISGIIRSTSWTGR
jgi:putative membrane protein